MSRFPPVAELENPIAGKDVAETFGESDVSLSHKRTQASGESLGFAPHGTVAVTNDYGTASGKSGWYGMEINPNRDLDGVRCKLASNSGDTTDVRIADSTGSTIQSSATTLTSGDTHDFNVALSANTTYYVEVKTGGSYMYDGDANPYPSDDIDVTAGSVGGASDPTGYSWSEITALVTPTNGTITVEWPYPTDIYRWDAATFQRTLDNESVDVFIEESSDGGATWTEIAGPINRGQDIPADPDNECRLRVDLSRANTANNPTLDAIYRRWVV